MAKILLIPLEAISGQNEAFTGIACDENRKKALAACYSSFYYYNSIEDRIASIVVSLIKVHYFIDGNKRTALFCYIMLSKINALNFITNTNEQADTFISLAASHKNVEECAKILFPRS